MRERLSLFEDGSFDGIACVDPFIVDQSAAMKVMDAASCCSYNALVVCPNVWISFASDHFHFNGWAIKRDTLVEKTLGIRNPEAGANSRLKRVTMGTPNGRPQGCRNKRP